LQQVLSAPYSSALTAAPQGNLFAWVEDAEGRHNLWVSGPNQLPRQLTHNTQDDAQDITQLTWAPDASAIAYTYGAESGANGKPANPAHLQRPTPLEVFVQPLTPGAQPILIGDGHEPLFTPDGRSLLFVRDGQIWIADPANPADAHQLVFDRGSASSLILSPDGHTLAFVSRRSEVNQPSHSFLALYDLDARTLRFLDASTSNDSAPVFSPGGNQIAWLRSPFIQPREFAAARTSPNPWSIQLANVTTGVTRTLFSARPNKPGSVLTHLADGAARLFFATNTTVQFYSEADGWVHLYQIHTDADPVVDWLTPGSFEVEDATLSSDHRYLVYSSNETSAADPRLTGEHWLDSPSLDQDRRHLWRIDLTNPDHPVEITHGEGIETHPQVAANGAIAALVSDAHVPMHPAFIDDNGRIIPVRSDAAAADYPTTLVTPKQVLFSSSDGIHLHGQLFRADPATPKPETPNAATHDAAASAHAKHPAILFVHGGPNRQMLLGYPSMGYYSNAYAMNQYLTAQGFIVLSVNYRCGIGYGLDFRECRNAGAIGGTEYNDVLAAANYLRNVPGVDPKRIGIWGGSYGGYLTALALARNSNLFAAGVDFHGVHDWNFEDNATDWKQGSFAEQDAIAAKARASSPLASLDRWHSPILLIHGDNDPSVAYAQTPILAQALRARHIPVDELIFPDEVHEFLLHKDWLAAYQATAAFFLRTLKP
jgi:dipeptidyl aminopeptidase/acylaminoacyl peptidase